MAVLIELPERAPALLEDEEELGLLFLLDVTVIRKLGADMDR